MGFFKKPQKTFVLKGHTKEVNTKYYNGSAKIKLSSGSATMDSVESLDKTKNNPVT